MTVWRMSPPVIYEASRGGDPLWVDVIVGRRSSRGRGPLRAGVFSGWGSSLCGCHLRAGVLSGWGPFWGQGVLGVGTLSGWVSSHGGVPLEVGVWGPGKPGQHQIWPPRAGEERARPWCAPAVGREWGAESPDVSQTLDFIPRESTHQLLC